MAGAGLRGRERSNNRGNFSQLASARHFFTYHLGFTFLPPTPGHQLNPFPFIRLRLGRRPLNPIKVPDISVAPYQQRCPTPCAFSATLIPSREFASSYRGPSLVFGLSHTLGHFVKERAPINKPAVNCFPTLPSVDCFGTPVANLAALDSKAFGRASEAVAEMAQPSAEPGDDYE